MKRLYLTAEEKNHLELRHQACDNRKEGDRIKAILLRSEGWTVPQISQALRLHQSTIIKHIQDYKTEGKLSNESGGSSSHLTSGVVYRRVGLLPYSNNLDRDLNTLVNQNKLKRAAPGLYYKPKTSRFGLLPPLG